MIYLGEKFTNGGERDIYLHPYDCTKVIKIRRIGSKVDRNAIESEFYQQLSEQVKVLLPRYYGWVRTNLGDGTVWDAIRNIDGSISKTLIQSALDKEVCFSEGLALVSDFYRHIMKQNLLLNDDNLNNYLVQDTPLGKRLILVDGYGSHRGNLKSYLRHNFRILGRYKIKKMHRIVLEQWRDLFDNNLSA